MTCRECKCAKKGYFASKPDAWVCIGVKEPFVISDIDAECTEYHELRGKKSNDGKTRSLNYGVIREFKDGTTLCYEPLGGGDDYFVLRASDGDALKMWLATIVNRIGG